jgi:uncharacterized protein YjiS (DUF1127 family)
VRDLGDAAPAEDLPTKAGFWRRLMQWVFRGAEDPRHVRRLSDQHLRDIGLSRGQAHDLFERRRDPRF